jgi:hypothetical protein
MMAGGYRVLSQPLWPTADAVQQFLKKNHGITSIKVEEEIHKDVPRPTLQGRATDNTIICVDVHEDACYTPSTELFIAKCKSIQLPVRLYTAHVQGAESPDFPRQLRQARLNCVGVLSVNTDGITTILSETLPQTLADVRRLDLSRFPSKYRDRLSIAQQTYLQGDPVKGCAGIHEVMEDITREVARKLYKKGRIAAWTTNPPNLDKDPWYNIAKAIYNEPTFQQFFPNTQPAIWAELIAQTKPRNEASHPPPTPAKRAERDKKLRTRFEQAGDTLAEVVEVIKNAKI